MMWWQWILVVVVGMILVIRVVVNVYDRPTRDVLLPAHAASHSQSSGGPEEDAGPRPDVDEGPSNGWRGRSACRTRTGSAGAICCWLMPGKGMPKEQRRLLQELAALRGDDTPDADRHRSETVRPGWPVLPAAVQVYPLTRAMSPPLSKR